MSILIGADLVPTTSNQKLFESGDVTGLLGENLKDLFKSVDYRVLNLEVPLADTKTPISKKGEALIAPTRSVFAMKVMNIDLFTLANNHVMDQGVEGLRSTCACLRNAGIDYIGVGNNAAEARASRIVEVKGKRVGFYACAEHEFSIAGENKPGANPIDLLYSPDHVAELKEECDYVIVLYHGGKEYYRYPSPQLQRVCRRLVEKGANLVVCQHSHCLGTYEKYQDGTIVYGQGNFLFDDGERECLQTGMMIRIHDNMTVDFVPIVRAQNVVRLADDERASEILESLERESTKIADEDFVYQQYSEFAKEYQTLYFKALSGIGRRNVVFRALNRVSGHRWENLYFRRKYDEGNCLTLKNYLECEAHIELIKAGINDRLDPIISEQGDEC